MVSNKNVSYIKNDWLVNEGEFLGNYQGGS
jgi:hypothetical protein